MVGEKNDRDDFKRPCISDGFKGIVQAFPRQVSGEKWLAIICNHSEKVGAAFDVVTPVVRHQVNSEKRPFLAYSAGNQTPVYRRVGRRSRCELDPPYD